MKKLFLLLIVAALLLTAGCSGTGEVASSDVPLPESEGSPVAAEESSSAPVTEAVLTTAAPVTEAPATETPATETFSTEALSTEAPVESTEAEEIDPWSLLAAASFEQGSFSDENGDFSYTYELPCILAETEGARAINAAIDARFGADVREAKKGMAEGTSPNVMAVGFRGVVWEDVLTVLVIEHFDFDWADYGVYCYEVSTGRRLTTPMVLARMGVSEADFLEACRQQFRARFEEHFSGVPEEFREQADYYGQLEAQSSDEYVNLELMVYPAEGELVVVAPIMSLAGPAFFYEELPLGLN